MTLTKRQQDSKDNTLITAILLASGIVIGLFVFYNMQIVAAIQNYIVK